MKWAIFYICLFAFMFLGFIDVLLELKTWKHFKVKEYSDVVTNSIKVGFVVTGMMICLFGMFYTVFVL